MAERKSRGKRGRSAKRRPRRASRESATWEEHNDRVRYAVAMSTERFLRENKDNIGRSPAESVARNSYVAGMIDMLTTARNAFGFWGADQVLNELERTNRKLALAAQGTGQGGDVPQEPGSDGPVSAGSLHGGPPPVEGGAAKVAKGHRRDPMFA